MWHSLVYKRKGSVAVFADAEGATGGLMSITTALVVLNYDHVLLHEKWGGCRNVVAIVRRVSRHPSSTFLPSREQTNHIQ
jgi:hypothetical protein